MSEEKKETTECPHQEFNPMIVILVQNDGEKVTRARKCPYYYKPNGEKR